MSKAENITRRSGSNLAFAFFCLPKEKRRDISTFYAFCRHVDDIADDPGLPTEDRRARLEGWAAGGNTPLKLAGNSIPPSPRISSGRQCPAFS